MTLEEEELLNKLKDKSKVALVDNSEGKLSLKQQCYVEGTYLNNLFLEEEDFEQYKGCFEKGYGHELKPNKICGSNGHGGYNCKMQSLHSSSAMIVNILGRKKGETLKIRKDNDGFPKGEYSLSFERQFRTLKTRSAFANVDAFLLSKNRETAVLIESKMLEYISGSKPKAAEAYTNDSGNYYSDGSDFVGVFKTAENLFKDSRFDYPQLIKHALGFYNALDDHGACFKGTDSERKDLKSVRNVILLNVVWKAEGSYKNYDKKWAKENPGDENLKTMEEKLGEIMKKRGIEKFHILFLSHKQLIDMVEEGENRLEYLKRYDL